jgi:Flp pilus assembly protein TadD
VTAAAALASLVVAAVAAAAVMRPFRRGGAPVLERLSDPLEDERRSLLRSLKELDEEHAAGTLPEDDYRSLRRDTEVRAVAVLKTLAADQRTAPALREIRPPSGNGHLGKSGDSRRRAAMPVLVVLAAVVAIAVPLLSTAIGGRSGGQAITGDNPAGQNPLSFFQRRVAEHPTDVAARLDLAARYEAAGDLTDATTQYLAALRLNPSDSEANAAVAYLLFLSGDARAALRRADRSLGPEATYPEGLWMKGLILARGLHRDAAAAAALRAYLRAAPYGSHRSQALRLLSQLST